jgi:hypothetical protein
VFGGAEQDEVKSKRRRPQRETMIAGLNQLGSTATAFMPDGKPAPLVLTEAELIQLLRLDGSDGPKNPGETIRRYRGKGLLRGVQIGRAVRYPLAEIQRFLSVKATENGSS